MSSSETESIPSISVDDCWIRNLTNADHVARDGTIHRQALKNRTISPSVGKPWTHELSGRLRSLASDLVLNGEAAAERARENFRASGAQVPSKIRFIGWACASVGKIRAAPVECEVIRDPTTDDPAHANFVIYNASSDDDLDAIRSWLIANLAVVGKDSVQDIDDKCS